MKRRLGSLRRFLGRYWYDGLTALIASLITISAAIAAVYFANAWISVGGAATAGLFGMAMRVLRAERERGRRRVDERDAAKQVAELASAHLMQHVIWRDVEAEGVNRERLIEALVDARMGRNKPKPELMPVRPQWTAISMLESGEEAINPRAIDVHEWVDVSRALREARGSFSASVGPFTPSLSDRGRLFMRAALEGHEEASTAMLSIALHSDDQTPETAEAVHDLFEALRFAQAAITRLGREADAD